MEFPVIKKFLVFKDITSLFPGRKTLIIEVRNTSGSKLGLLVWQNGWRRYIFEPKNQTIYDSSCLKEIISTIDQLMGERKSGRDL